MIKLVKGYFAKRTTKMGGSKTVFVQPKLRKVATGKRK